MEHIDDAVFATPGGDVLKPAIVDAVIAGVREAMKPATVSRELTRRRDELGSVEGEIARLTEAIATANSPLPTLLKALQARQTRHDELIGLEAQDGLRPAESIRGASRRQYARS